MGKAADRLGRIRVQALYTVFCWVRPCIRPLSNVHSRYTMMNVTQHNRRFCGRCGMIEGGSYCGLPPCQQNWAGSPESHIEHQRGLARDGCLRFEAESFTQLSYQQSGS